MHYVERWTQGAVLTALAVLAAAFGAGAARSDAPLPDWTVPPVGLMVDSVEAGGAAERAGLRRGDVLLRWSRVAAPVAAAADTRGELRTPFDLDDVEVEQAPLGTITLAFERDGRPLSVDLGPGSEWRLVARAQLQGADLVSYERGREQLDTGALEGASATWAELARVTTDAWLAAWLIVRVQMLWSEAERWPEGLDLGPSLARLPLDEKPRIAAAVAEARAVELMGRSLWDESHAAFLEAAGHWQRAGAGSLRLAAAGCAHGQMLRFAGRHAPSREQFERAIATYRGEAPRSARLVESLARLAVVSPVERGDELAREALALGERVAPESVALLSAAWARARTSLFRGALDEAERFYRRAAGLAEKLVPRTPGHAMAVLNVAVARAWLGDYAAAQDSLRHARALSHEGPGAGASILARLRLTEAYVASHLGDLESARRANAEALAEAERDDPQGHALVEALIDRGQLPLDANDVEAADHAVLRALRLADKLPQDALAGDLQRTRGRVALARGDHAAAREALERAWDVHRVTMPGTMREALAIFYLARLERAAGQRQRALELHALAVRTIDSARERTGLSGSYFTAGYADLYADLVDALVEAGRSDEAFAVLERSRARALLSQLSERELQDDGALPPELARERRAVEREYARERAELMQGVAELPTAEADARQARARELERRLDDVEERVRRADPRLAALQYPRALDEAAVSAALDPGTLLLAYSVGERATVVFALAGGETALAARRLPVGRDELRQRVDAFRALLGQPPGDAQRAREIEIQARELFELLLRPMSERLAGARRVLVSPDAALLALPFAALRDGERWLVESLPLHSVASGSVYAQLRAPAGAPPRDASVTVFADPRYGRRQAAALRLRGSGARERALELEPLPSTRVEARAIARAYRGRSALFLGADASEARLRVTAGSAQLLHFACHAFADERSPMHSALVLSAPARRAADEDDAADDGLMEAWEITRHLRLRADLVTLSACQSALGAELAGEGLFGLTRAFLHAGARSVVGSLWAVADESTAELMKVFYRDLRRGASKDEALRNAQAALLRGRWRDPFHWAAFQLHGARI